ncbi:hypothetical protein EW146_g3371 [Bondarzewia mesenterica]|uniref:ARID domain-containing protein n=1 Tax=Bondarzewia mesenterica TaxID=1095465 RepID=A0A4S4M3M9_9AGAM|nr:hypothetical protein EW146_g3371 [Bondarzewia mesenterica]
MHKSPRGTPARRGKSPRVLVDSPTRPSGGPSAPLANTSSIDNITAIASTSEKPTSTFTSCLKIPVQGAVPITRPEPSAPQPATITNTTVTAAASNNSAAAPDAPAASSAAPTSRRAPRKSKTEALAALQTHANASDDGDQDMDVFSPSMESAQNGFIKDVRTTSPREIPGEGTKPRPFGLTNCPTYYPTKEEFRDPMAYVKKISETAREFGMCKVVPPEGWKVPFVTDTENFRFTTRLQRLNNIEASSRAKINYLEQLYRFHQQQGNNRVVVPTINNKPLDVWLLRKEVHALGGYEAVTKAKKWADLGRLLGYGGIPGLSTQMKNSYVRVVLPYEQFCERVRASPALASLTSAARDPQLRTHVNTQIVSKQAPVAQQQQSSQRARPSATPAVESPPSSPLTETSSPLSEPPDEADFGKGESLTKEQAAGKFLLSTA